MSTSTTHLPITIIPGVDCDTVEFVQRYLPVKILELTQLFFSTATIFLVIFSCVIQRQSYFHPNVKFLLKIYNAALLGYSFAMCTTQLYHLLTFQIFESCELLIMSMLCFPFRFVFTSTIIIFALVVSSIPIERTIATTNLTKGYEDWKPHLGHFLGVLMISFSILFSLFYHIHDLSNNRTSQNCIYDVNDVIPNGLMVVFCAMNSISLFFIIVLLGYNRYRLFRKTYALSAEFQINQNLRVLNLLFPISLLTFIAFSWHFIVDFYFKPVEKENLEVKRFLQMLQNGFPIYTFLSSAIWLLLMSLERKKRKTGHERMVATLRKDEKDVYFRTLQDQWSRHPTPKHSRIQLFNVFTVPRQSI